MPVKAPRFCFYRRLIPVGALFVVMLLCLTAGNAQGPLTRHAISLAESGQLEEAEYKLAAAMATDEARDPMTWYVQAYVQKERFVARGKQVDDPLRGEALRSAEQCRLLDSDQNMDQWLVPLLEFLAESHLEDMRAAIPEATPGKPPRALDHFSAYAKVLTLADPEWDEIPEWVLLHQQLGEHGMESARLYEQGAAGPWFDMGVHHYTLAGERQHDRYRSVYNLAVHTYNQGVREFKAAEDDLDAVDAALARAAKHWQRASDLLATTIDIDSGQTEAYEAWAIVSKALLNQDRVDWCRDHIEELRGGR